MVYFEHLSSAGLHARSLICIIVSFYHKPLGSGWVLKNWCFWTVELEKSLESPLGSKEINQSIPKEINPDIHWKDWCWSWSANTLATWCEEQTHWKNAPPGAGEDWGQEEKGKTEDEMVGWHHWLNGHEFDSNGQGNLVCCSPWCCKVSDMTEQLNNNNNILHRRK